MTKGRHRDVVADGVRLRVLEAGEGPPLLLLHGLSASHDIWEHVVDEFADRHRVVAPDLPGHGESAKPDAPYTIDFYAGVVRTLARELGIDRAIVGGSSLGGKIALELACWYPRFVEALVLAAPASEYARGLRPFGKAIQALSRPSVMRAALDRALEQTFYDRTLIGHVTRRRILAARLAADDFPDFARAIARSVGGVLAAESQPLGRITQPVLAVWGREDRIVPAHKSAQLVRSIPHARLRVIERCGHIAMLEQPTEFNRHMGEFLAALGSGAALDEADGRSGQPGGA
ncbi:MAG TPA: alpha/beta fold hydrolase [Candidatus Eisenbacteria bacterium]|nr:alpha/beta fold hydrolase [Candidatus Eisenbacteria bacterium]